MTRKPEGKSPPEGPRESPSQGGERLGPLEIERLSKDDGRALILYSVVGSREDE